MKFDSKTQLYGILGDPIGHTLSPVMHNAAFAAVNYPGVYFAFEVKDLAGALTGAKALNLKGLSITIPYKVKALNLVDKLDETARRIGALNTIINRNGNLYGFNSDSPGAMAALAEKTAIKDKNVAIIGAGGAARALAYGIKSRGGALSIYNRSLPKARQLASELDASYFPLSEFGNKQCDILINTTSVGMTPNYDDMPVAPQTLNKNMVVMDIIYNPLKTALLKAADKIGCVIVDGVSMFIYQGALQFEMWTHTKAPVDIMRETVLKALK